MRLQNPSFKIIIVIIAFIPTILTVFFVKEEYQKFMFFLTYAIAVTIVLIWSAISLIIRMKRNPEEFTKEKVYSDYKYSPISMQVGPGVRLFIFFTIIPTFLVILYYFLSQIPWSEALK